MKFEPVLAQIDDTTFQIETDYTDLAKVQDYGVTITPTTNPVGYLVTGHAFYIRSFFGAIHTLYELQVKRAELLEHLRPYHETITMEYSGYGDSGDIESCSVDDSDVAEFLWEMMWTKHSGFENNEGGNGTVTWDLKLDQITIEHREAYTEYHDYNSVL